MLFAPVSEQCGLGHKSFICHPQFYEFKQESFVPTVIGFNSAEGGALSCKIFVTHFLLYLRCLIKNCEKNFSALFNDTSVQYPEIHTDFNKILSILLAYDHHNSVNDVNKIGNEVFRKYFPSGKIEDHSHSKFVEVI